MTRVLSWGTNRAGKLPGLVFPLLVLLVGALLLLCRLDDAYLWQDEAETAIVSRNLLAFGLPLSTDGTNWVQQAGRSFVEFTADYVWLYHSWLQYALTAVSFGLLGPTTLAARLPFALFGLATVALLYRLVQRWVADERVARVATVLLVLSVPFALLLRQCRYYAPSAFFTLLMLDAYLHLRAGAQWGIPYFVLAAVLLYHSHYGAFFPSVVAVGVDMLVSRERRDGWRQFVIALALITAFVLPWAHFMRVLYRGQPFRLDRFAAHVGQHVVYITAWVFPLVLVALLLLAWWRTQRGGAGPEPTASRFLQTCVHRGCDQRVDALCRCSLRLGLFPLHRPPDPAAAGHAGYSDRYGDGTMACRGIWFARAAPSVQRTAYAALRTAWGEGSGMERSVV